MKLSLDRTLRIIWLMIGLLLLLFLLGGGVMILSQVIGNWGAKDDAVRIVNQSQPAREEPRAVRLGETLRIRGTTTRLATVENGRAYAPGSTYASGSRYSRAIVANVVFLDAEGARLLLDRPAHVESIRFPQSSADIQRWIEYRIAFDDTNRDGKLDARDQMPLYVTDLEGRNLRPVLRAPLRLQSTQVMDATRMLVYALEPPAGQAVDEDRMRQRAFIYDVAAGQLSPYTALDSAAARAGQILAR